MIAELVTVLVFFSIAILALGLVPERRRPSSAMAWLLLIFFLPGIGLLLFLLLGSPYRAEEAAGGAAGGRGADPERSGHGAGAAGVTGSARAGWTRRWR